MIVVIPAEKLSEASKLMNGYGHKLVYQQLQHEGRRYYAVTEGPIAALLMIRATLTTDAIQRKFGLL